MASRHATVRALIALSLVAGLTYPLLWEAGLPEAAEIALKGAGVGLLALAAAARAASRELRLLAILLGLGAAGDVLLEIVFMAGAAAVAAGHAVAIRLYLTNRRQLNTADFVVPALLLLFGASMPLVLLRGSDDVAAFLAYSLLLSAMAASAWLSRYPRHFAGLGALLFVASDTLIALRMARPEAELGLAIWLLYFCGQLLIFLGVSGWGRRPREAEAAPLPGAGTTIR